MELYGILILVVVFGLISSVVSKSKKAREAQQAQVQRRKPVIDPHEGAVDEPEYAWPTAIDLPPDFRMEVPPEPIKPRFEPRQLFEGESDSTAIHDHQRECSPPPMPPVESRLKPAFAQGLDRESMMRAVVMSEILGKPRALKRR